MGLFILTIVFLARDGPGRRAAYSMTVTVTLLMVLVMIYAVSFSATAG
jgi:hypothetical protein